jgi:hypothetical protein
MRKAGDALDYYVFSVMLLFQRISINFAFSLSNGWEASNEDPFHASCGNESRKEMTKESF